MEVEGTQGLIYDVLFFKKIVELDNIVVIQVQILLEHLENFFSFLLYSLLWYHLFQRIKQK